MTKTQIRQITRQYVVELLRCDGPSDYVMHYVLQRIDAPDNSDFNEVFSTVEDEIARIAKRVENTIAERYMCDDGT